MGVSFLCKIDVTTQSSVTFTYGGFPYEIVSAVLLVDQV